MLGVGRGLHVVHNDSNFALWSIGSWRLGTAVLECDGVVRMWYIYFSGFCNWGCCGEAIRGRGTWCFGIDFPGVIHFYHLGKQSCFYYFFDSSISLSPLNYPSNFRRLECPGRVRIANNGWDYSCSFCPLAVVGAEVRAANRSVKHSLHLASGRLALSPTISSYISLAPFPGFINIYISFFCQCFCTISI